MRCITVSPPEAKINVSSWLDHMNRTADGIFESNKEQINQTLDSKHMVHYSLLYIIRYYLRGGRFVEAQVVG